MSIGSASLERGHAIAQRAALRAVAQRHTETSTETRRELQRRRPFQKHLQCEVPLCVSVRCLCVSLCYRFFTGLVARQLPSERPFQSETRDDKLPVSECPSDRHT